MSEGYTYRARRQETGLPKYYLRLPAAERRRLYPAPPDAHGTSMGYGPYACRCPRCRSWARDSRAAAARGRTLA